MASLPRRRAAARRAAAPAVALTVALTLAITLLPATGSTAAPARSTAAVAQAPRLPDTPVAADKKKPGKGNGIKSQRATWIPPAGASFNTPRSSTGVMYRNEARIIDAINHARRNSTIKMAMFSFDRKQVSDALIRAYRKRNITVQVIVNGHEKPGAQKDMQRVFGKRYKKRKWKSLKKRYSYYYQCTSACRGHFDVQHSKFVLFSKTGAATNVVQLGSLNMKVNGAVNQFNDLLTINDSPKLYESLSKTMQEMKRDKNIKNPLKHESFGKYELWTLPFARMQGATKRTEWRFSRDPITKILDQVTCTGARTDNGRTIIRVNMHAWDGNRGAQLATRFRQLYAEGCDVKIMVGFAGYRVRQTFGSRTARGFVPVRSTGFDTDEDLEIDLYSHTKILTINGNFNGKRDRKIVVTGSSNYQDGGQYGDELILKVNSAKVYRQYADNWGYVYRNHTHGFAFNGGTFRARADGRGFVYTKPFIYDGLGIDSEEWRDQ